MYDAPHNDDTQHSSPTAIACEQAELFGATPGPDEPDNRDLWDEDDAMQAVDSAFHGFARDIARDGTQLADERESFLCGFVNLFHAQVNRLDRAVDALRPKLRDLQRAQDGTEINAHELERTVDRARALGDRRDAFEKMRDHAADAYRTETGSTWRPRRGSHVSQTRKMTAAAIDSRDFLRAREHRANEAHLPDGMCSRIRAIAAPAPAACMRASAGRWQSVVKSESEATTPCAVWMTLPMTSWKAPEIPLSWLRIEVATSKLPQARFAFQSAPTPRRSVEARAEGPRLRGSPPPRR